ncbi:13596_t:CDS:2, partial [Dentiscutata heterogama]
MAIPNESITINKEIENSNDSWYNTWCEKDFENLPMLPGNHSLKITFHLIKIYKRHMFTNSELLKAQTLLIHSQYFRPILEDLIHYSLKIYKFHQDNETDHRDIVEKMYLAIMDFCENVVGIPTLNDKEKIICTRHNAIQHEDPLGIEQESFVQIHDCLLFHLLNLRLRVVEIVDQDGIMFDLEQQIIKRCEKSKL